MAFKIRAKRSQEAGGALTGAGGEGNSRFRNRHPGGRSVNFFYLRFSKEGKIMSKLLTMVRFPTPGTPLKTMPIKDRHAQGQSPGIGDSQLTPVGLRSLRAGGGSAAKIFQGPPASLHLGPQFPAPGQYRQDQKAAADSHVQKEMEGVPGSQPGPQGRQGFDVPRAHTLEGIREDEKAETQSQAQKSGPQAGPAMDAQLKTQTGRGRAEGKIVGNAPRFDVFPGHPEGKQQGQQQRGVISQPDVYNGVGHADTSTGTESRPRFVFRFGFFVFRKKDRVTGKLPIKTVRFTGEPGSFAINLLLILSL